MGYVIAVIIWGVILGVATQKVIENKGYSENWFWWGVFFGFIALIVAATRPEVHYSSDSSYGNSILSQASEERFKEIMLRDGGWKCKCGRVNPSYTETCACGRTKSEVEELNRKQAEEANKKDKMEKENLNLDSLKKAKELLDMGAITQEEFEKKKKQILDI